jgi:predicted pyridoxine 5'-phosphate oxidase superfamily flavin-nucleotide-binding protein
MNMQNYLDLATGPDSIEHQRQRGSRAAYQQIAQVPAATGLGPDELHFLSRRDSLYIASIGPNGWPYVQHRGGAPGFVRVIDPTHLAWAERSGNKQFLSAGNVDHDDRVSVIAVDYPNRRRLKLHGRATFDTSPSADRLTALGIDGRIEGVMAIEVVAFDWNCPKFITPRFTEDEVRASVEPLHRRIAELEALLAERVS